ncbi:MULTISPECIES: PQQ-binding-like beta-propeller repeat protein [Bacillus cereus group]|uniref:outer membrane protein assembly factor BamB family protein n=1 Tax=Bacillus cereus group TaxID=86661 RepID=UPI00187AF209|nr:MULTISPECIES: PQQ-binding-like beta-propeller repeat protein [Bacillus cereus group]MBE7098176.1 PQQ-like beta-propeller repeat protein [Bacillus cereus]MED2037262.1 PQQ-binding-like beta-propeller repeat protein [Bacillus wiedmannii]
MKKKFMLMMLLFALMVGLHPNSMTKAETTSTQGEQFEQGKYDLQAEFPFGQNWNKNSPYAGPETVKVKWEYKLYKDSAVPNKTFEYQPAIGSDGTIYIGNSTRKLYAFNKDGSIKWIKDGVANSSSTPVIAEDGTIYVTSEKLTALNPDGSIKWQVKDASTSSSPIIDSEGTVYVHNSKSITAYNSNGSKKWESSQMFKEATSSKNSMLMSKDGTLYTLLSSGENYFLYAHDKNGKELWNKRVRGNDGNPGFSLGLNNELFINGGSVLYVFDKDGNLIKQWKQSEVAARYAPTISSKDGTIYIAASGGVTAYNRDYTLKWKYSTGQGVEHSPVIDKNGVVYVKARQALFAVNPDGTLKWKMPFSAFHKGSSNNSISIDKDGTLYLAGYVPNTNNNGPSGTYYSLVAIGDSYTDTVCTKESTYMEVLKSLEAKSKNAKLTNEEKKEARDILKKLSDDLDKTDK